MITIVVANKKGGVGKTTTAQNVAAAFCGAGKKVLAIDMDPQANLSRAWGATDAKGSVIDVLRKKTTWQSIATLVERNQAGGGCVLLAPANRQLAAMSEIFAQEYGKELLLKESLVSLGNAVDLVIIDSPPGLDLQTINTYAAADLMLIPVQTEFYALEGLALLLDDLDRVRQRLNPALITLGVIPTFVDRRKRLCKDVLTILAEKHGPYITSPIRDNVALAEAPSHGKSIFCYDPKSYGAEDYTALSAELLKRMEGYNVA